MKTFSAKPETVTRGWYLVDANGKTLGRLATELARRLRGKHKPEYTPHVDTGDYLVVINAEKVRVTGRKLEDKIYHRHTGYIGNMKHTSLGKMMNEHPERAIEMAVQGMLPKNPLGRATLSCRRTVGGTMRRGSASLNAVSTLAMLFLYGPIFVLVLYSFNAAHLSMAWSGATLKWYGALLHDEALLAATANSLLIAVVSTLGAVDRKSTRLNSSHQKISYAVFCLK